MRASAKNAVEKFQFVSFNHPIFHPFLSADYGNLMEITVSKYSSLKANQAMPLIFQKEGPGCSSRARSFRANFSSLPSVWTANMSPGRFIKASFRFWT